MLRYILNRYIAAFLVLSAAALFLINNTGESRLSLTPFEKIMKNIVSPVENGISHIVNSTSDTVEAVFSIGTIKEQNKSLTERVAKLQAENTLLKEYEYQNLRLRELLNYKDSISRSYQTVSASVIARNPSNWFNTVTINKGESDGIKKNMAVITSFGLVGHVINVSSNSAEVLLIVDNSSAVGGLVQITRTPGVIEGIGDNTGNLRMNYLAKEAPIRENQVVISSGLGGIFPKGIPIGKITKIETDTNGLERYAIVRPFIDFNRIEEVLVIKTVFGEQYSPATDGGE